MSFSFGSVRSNLDATETGHQCSERSKALPKDGWTKVQYPARLPLGRLGVREMIASIIQANPACDDCLSSKAGIEVWRLFEA